MKKFIVFIGGFVFVLIGIYLAVYIFINTQGKKLFLDFLKKKYHTEAQLESLKLSFPFRLTLKNFNYQDVSFSQAKVTLIGINPFNLSFILTDIYVENLSLNIEGKDKGFVIKPFLDTTNGFSTEEKLLPRKSLPKQKNTQKKNVSFIAKKLFLKDATVNLRTKLRNLPLTVSFKDLNLKVRGLCYPKLSKFYFELTSSLEAEEKLMKDFINAKGWVDWNKKDMDVVIHLVGFDYLAFGRYYPPFWRPENLQLKEAFLSLDALLNSVNNDLTINATLYLDKFSFIDEPQEPSKVESLKTLIDLFREDKDSKPTLHFLPIKTRMDKLELDLSSIWEEIQKKVKVSFLGTVIRFLGKTPEFLGKGTKEIKKMSIDPAVEALKGIVDIIKGLIIPSPQENPEEGEKEGEKKFYLPDLFKIEY